MDKTEKMRTIRDEVINLISSPLYDYRVENKFFPVIGEGSHDAHIMFVGEAPGENEAKHARPFCGRSGKLLDELLASINLNRPDVYITNIVKDRPPENRDPTPQEIDLYTPFLDRQISIIQPKVIVTLGRFSMSYILKHFNIADYGQPISKNHGKLFKTESSYGTIYIIPLYHPAVGLYNGSMKTVLLSDFQLIKSVLQ